MATNIHARGGRGQKPDAVRQYSMAPIRPTSECFQFIAWGGTEWGWGWGMRLFPRVDWSGVRDVHKRVEISFLRSPGEKCTKIHKPTTGGDGTWAFVHLDQETYYTLYGSSDKRGICIRRPRLRRWSEKKKIEKVKNTDLFFPLHEYNNAMGRCIIIRYWSLL